MFIWLTNPTIGQVLVNLNLVRTGQEHRLFHRRRERLYCSHRVPERIQSAEKRYRK